MIYSALKCFSVLCRDIWLKAGKKLKQYFRLLKKILEKHLSVLEVDESNTAGNYIHNILGDMIFVTQFNPLFLQCQYISNNRKKMVKSFKTGAF